MLPKTEGELAEVRDSELYMMCSSAMFFKNLPIQNEIATTAKDNASIYDPEEMSDGWIGSMTIETTGRDMACAAG